MVLLPIFSSFVCEYSHFYSGRFNVLTACPLIKNTLCVPPKATGCLCQNWSGAHFTNDFSITIQIRWKFHLALIQVLMTISQQNLAHATTAQLSCHVPNFVAITLLVSEWEQNEISITFELWWKNCQWNGSQAQNILTGCITPMKSDSHICISRVVKVSSRQTPGPRLNIKTVLSTYGDFHVKDKTAVRTSYL